MAMVTDVKNVFLVFFYFKIKNAFLTFFTFPTFFINKKTLANISSCNNMQLKETCFFDV